MDHSELLEYLHYDPMTGIFTRKVSAGNCKAGDQVGCISKQGYMKALVLKKYVKLHRLAWFYVYGVWPSKQLDHINQVKTDNRIANLREVSTSENCTNQTGARKNNVLGLQGVHLIKKTGRYRAGCSVGGVKHHLGVFATAEEAHQAYKAFKAPYLP